MTRTSRQGTRGSTGGSHEAVDVDVDVAELEAALRDAVDGELRFDAGSRGTYATDGSNYRQVPVPRGPLDDHRGRRGPDRRSRRRGCPQRGATPAPGSALALARRPAGTAP